MLIESNTNISSLPGFGANFGTKEARFALAMSAAGLGGGGGGGGGLTQAEAQAAFTAALQSQAASEFSDMVLQDSAGTKFIRRTSIDEETGAIAFSNLNLDGTSATVVPPFSLPSTILNNTRLAKAIAVSTGVAIGDILEFKYSADSNTPHVIATSGWNNLTQQVNNIAAPPASNYIYLDQITSGDVKARLVNSAASAILIKPTNGIIKSIYIDNLAAGIIFVQVFQGLTALPAVGAVPLESYRCPSNGSISFDFGPSGVVYTGQIYLGFSTTAGTFTAAANNKNLVVNYR